MTLIDKLQSASEGSPELSAGTKIMMCGRRTIMSGEVVTFSTSFEQEEGCFGYHYKATGHFDISASRDAVMVHRAECKNAQESELLIHALVEAEKVRAHLEPYWRGGEPSKYPDHPIAICIAAIRAREGK